MKDGGRRTKTYTQKVSVSPSYTVKDSCDLNFNTQLTNVQAEFANANVGDFLSIVYDGTSLTALNQLGEVCGYLNSAHDKVLIDCISRGNEYRARVMHTRPGVGVQKVI